MNSAHIIPLSEARDVLLVGGKAVNLAKLMEAGLPVPDGFVVSTAAYRDAKGTVSRELAGEIRKALKPFQGKRVVARSSATAEDMAGASMAGQYETYLNLESETQVIEAVEKCWQSIQSDRSVAYLNGHGIDPDEVAMAVVVQQQVTADVAGVLFTVDPRTGSAENMLIEATWGLGESLVSGDVQPDLIRVSATEPRVFSYDVADKKQAVFPGREGLQPVDENLRRKACLNYEQILRLQQLGRKAEAYFGSPQDVEWAVEGGEILMVQARPITTLAETKTVNRLLAETKAYLKKRSDEGSGLWVRHNLGETLPHPTPLTWSVVSGFMSGRGGFGKMHETLGFKPGPAVQQRSFLDRIGGEIYMDCSLMTEMFAENYPFAYDPELLRKSPDAAQNPPTVANGGFGAVKSAAKLAAEAAVKIDQLKTGLDKKFDAEFVPELVEWVAGQDAVNLQTVTDTELIQRWETQVKTVMDEFGAMAFLPSMVEAVAVEELRNLLDQHVWDHDPAELISVLSVSEKPDRTFAGNLALAKVASGELPLDEWLNDFGHRAPAEFDLASPRWNERPDAVLKMADQMGSADLEALRRERLSAADQALATVKSAVKPEIYEQIKSASDIVRRYLRFREDGKFYLMRAYSVLRKTALEIGRRLDIGDDVFFLTGEELADALSSGFVPKDTIAERKLEYLVEKRIPLPHVIESDDVEKLGEAVVREDSDALPAHSVSSGSVSGSASIVFSPENCGEFAEGSILVCPSTDPSWTPLFAKAGGLVLERGGSLSHGAVVAREMGLPAVVLDGATQLLKQGEMITVDANGGCIYREGAEIEPENSAISRSIIPPPASEKERKINQLGLVAALIWAVFLAAVFLLPPNILHDPVMRLLDILIWPLIRLTGMAGAVAVIAGLFGLLPIFGQRFLTDNRRLFEAKKRSGILRKKAAQLPAESGTRKKMEALAGAVTARILKASMVPLALILGVMIMVFMWFPLRVDPASWSAEPGRMVSIVAEISGECREPIRLDIAAPLSADIPEQVLPPIRAELEELRAEWNQSSDLSELPWEVQSAADQTRLTMLSSLNAFLKEGIPPQKITWLVSVPETADGAFPVELKIGGEPAVKFNLVFGRSVPPAPSKIPVDGSLVSVKVNYPRALKKAAFFKLPATGWDIGWLGVYLLAYLPAMFIAKFALRVP